jgi:hypothetical protein
MDNLPTWAVWIAAGAVGVAPGLAILCAPAIARLIHRVASPPREVTPKPSREPSHGEPTAGSVPRGWGGTDEVLTAAVLVSRGRVVSVP